MFWGGLGEVVRHGSGGILGVFLREFRQVFGGKKPAKSLQNPILYNVVKTSENVKPTTMVSRHVQQSKCTVLFRFHEESMFQIKHK